MRFGCSTRCSYFEIYWKSHLVCDLNDFNFLHCEILRTCEEVRDRGVIRVYLVTLASVNASAIAVVGATFFGNKQVIVEILVRTKYETENGKVTDCARLFSILKAISAP
jgi:hypothetical protein